MGSIRFFTQTLRAKGFTRPQKPSFSFGFAALADDEGVDEAAAGGVL
jgi:hypothetical protein